DGHVAVGNHHQIRFRDHFGQTKVEGPRGSAVFGTGDKPYVGELPAHHLGRAIGGSVVHHHDLDGHASQPRLFSPHRQEEIPEQIPRLVSDHDHGQARLRWVVYTVIARNNNGLSPCIPRCRRHPGSPTASLSSSQSRWTDRRTGSASRQGCRGCTTWW